MITKGAYVLSLKLAALNDLFIAYRISSYLIKLNGIWISQLISILVMG